MPFPFIIGRKRLKYIMDIHQLIRLADEGNKEAMDKVHVEIANESDEKITFTDAIVSLYRERSMGDTNPYSMHMYGRMNLFGWGVEKDIPTAIELFKRSAELGCTESYVMLAELMNASIIPWNRKKYFKLLEKVGDNCNGLYLIAQTQLSCEDDYTFLTCMEKSGEKGNSHAYHQIGQYYHDQSEFDMAKKYYKKAMVMGNSHSYLNMGVMYREGYHNVTAIPCELPGGGVEFVPHPNEDKALQMFKESEKLGNVKASVCIGHIYEKQGYVNRAKIYYKKAAGKNDKVAYFNLGRLYEDEGLEKKSIKMFLRGARLGHKICAIKLSNRDIPLDTKDEDLGAVIRKRNALRKAFSGFGAYDVE